MFLFTGRRSQSLQHQNARIANSNSRRRARNSGGRQPSFNHPVEKSGQNDTETTDIQEGNDIGHFGFDHNRAWLIQQKKSLENAKILEKLEAKIKEMEIGLEKYVKKNDQGSDQIDWSNDDKFEQVTFSLKKVGHAMNKVDYRFSKVDYEFEKIDHQFNKVDGRIDNTEYKVGYKMARMHEHFEHLISSLEEKFQFDPSFDQLEMNAKFETTITSIEERLKSISETTKSREEKQNLNSEQINDKYHCILDDNVFMGGKIELLEEEISKLSNQFNEMQEFLGKSHSIETLEPNIVDFVEGDTEINKNSEKSPYKFEGNFENVDHIIKNYTDIDWQTFSKNHETQIILKNKVTEDEMILSKTDSEPIHQRDVPFFESIMYIILFHFS